MVFCQLQKAHVGVVVFEDNEARVGLVDGPVQPLVKDHLGQPVGTGLHNER